MMRKEKLLPNETDKVFSLLLSPSHLRVNGEGFSRKIKRGG
jgi:hypothetical protein